MRINLLPKCYLTHAMIVIILITAVSCNRNQTEANGTPPEAEDEVDRNIKQAILWFPEDIESLTIAKGPFTLPEGEPDEGETLASQRIRYAFGPLNFSTDLRNRVSESIAGKEVVLAVTGTKEFRAAIDIGSGPFEGGFVLFFAEGIPDAIGRFEAEADHTEEAEGMRVLRFDVEEEQLEWPISMAFPSEKLLVCATTEGFLKTMISRMNGKPQERALPPELLEWQYVNEDDQFWGVRHFKRPVDELDPTTPFYPGQPHSDADAIGIVFGFNPKLSSVARALYLSENENAVEVMEGLWGSGGDGFSPEIQRIDKGVVEIRVDTNAHENNPIAFNFYLMLQLGHALGI